jgi:putative CocE/NonD family hydrolase
LRTRTVLSSAALLIAVLFLNLRVFAAKKMVVEKNVEVKMRDGVILRADVYQPAEEGKYPVLLERTPYDKSNKDLGVNFAVKAVGRGYVVIIQDVRGRYASSGEWYPFKHEIDDGYDTIEWAATLPFANGQVGMFGGSYVGATQMLAAIGHPPHLSGINPVVTASNYHENWAYQGGAFELGLAQAWAAALAQDTMNHFMQATPLAQVGDRIRPLQDFNLFNLKLGPGEVNLTRMLAPYYLDWLDHPLYDGYWKQWSIEDHYGSIQVPALTVAGWYDIFLGGSLRNFEGMKQSAGNESARNNQRLIIGIGGHAGSGRKVGDLDFGAEAGKADWDGYTLEWYDYLLKGEKTKLMQEPPVKYFAMGENTWRTADSWPPQGAHPVRYYLHSSGSANSASGDGVLSFDPGASEKSDRYEYDPDDAVPSVGGPICCDTRLSGPRDQREVEQRQDVLEYTTAPLAEDVDATGPVTVELYASSSALDTDFTAKLLDVWPNGYVQNLTEGILRARYRESSAAAQLMEPGKIYRIKIDLWATSNVFKKGHRIRVELSSSNFPRFDRNLNSGADAATDATSVKATNTIYHDREHPSALVLTLLPHTPKPL